MAQNPNAPHPCLVYILTTYLDMAWERLRACSVAGRLRGTLAVDQEDAKEGRIIGGRWGCRWGVTARQEG